MKKSRILSAVLSTAMFASCFTGFSVSAAPTAEKAVDTEYAVLSETLSFDFTSMTEVPAYSAETGSGFVGTTTSVASFNTVDDSDTSAGTGRTVAAVEEIVLDGGAKVTESDNEYVDGSDYNYGGLAFRVNVEPGMYNVKVEGIDGTTKDNTAIAVSGMQASRLTGTGAWDSAGLVAKTGYATWTDNTWSYDFVAGEGFIEVEVEPAKKPTADAPQTVGVKSITITPLVYDYPTVYDPTIFVLGDSTQKTYTFEENGMSGYGQVLGQMFGCRVVNYSMGGRSLKANYQEGRFNDVLMAAKPGDYVFIHSAHNDESTGTAGPAARFGRGSNEATYKNWLYNVYIPSMKAMGVTPVLVSSMPRLTGTGAPRDYFTPNSPAILKEAAETVEGVEFVDLFSGAIDYLSAIGTEEAKYIYMSIEAGETAGKTNSGSYANGHPDNKIDGTHYKEAAAKQWARIIAQDIYAQKGALADLLADNVKAACEDGNWTEHVFPEMANDVSTIGNTSADAKSQGDNAYYRNQIEKMLQLGIMAKDSEGNFNPDKDMTVGGFAEALTKLWDLDEAALKAYTEVIGEVKETEPPVDETPVPPVDETVPPVDETPKPTVDAVKIVAKYDADGRLTGVTTEDIKYDGTVEPVDGAKVFVWDSLESMKPAVAPKAEAASLAAAGDVTEWVVSAADAGAAEGTELMPGLTMLFTDEAGTGTYLSTSGSNGKFASGAITGTAMKFVAPEDGVLTVTFSNVGATKEVIIVSEGTSDKTAAEYYELGTSVAEAFVKGGTTYYTSVLGSKGRFVSVKFVAGTPPTPTPTATPDPNATPEPDYVDYTPISADAALTREAMAAIVYDAYEAKFGKAADGSWNKPVYMTNYNGTTVSPDDPEYDPNLTGKEAQYYPLVGWGVITDKEAIAAPLYAKVKEVYNLGLMRSEAGIARGSMKNGTEMEPTVIVTRAKAAKELYFLYNLIQNIKTENQVIPGENMAFTLVEELDVPNYERPRYPGGNEVEPTPTPKPTREPGKLPDDILWRADDAAFNSAIVVTAPTTVDGLTVYPDWTEKARTADYTHIDGTAYTFTRAWCGGTGSTTSRSLSFVPEEACTVTVVFDGNGSAGRTMNIVQGGTTIESKNSEGGVTVLTADIENPANGPVYIWGGGSNKNIFAVFVEYYDPNAIVYRNLSGNINYTGSIDMTGKNLVFTNTATGEATKVAYGSTYSVDLVQRSTYAITVEGYEEQICATLDTKEVYIAKADKTWDITLLEIADTEVKGEIVSHGLDMTGVTVTFTAQDDPTITKSATITAAGADKEMPEAEYALSVVLTPNHVYDVTTSDVTGWTMSDLSKTYTMAAGDTTPFKNLLFTKDVVATEWKDTVTVGADKEFQTITDAVKAIKAMTGRPSGEAGRTAIVVDPGTYCEQVTVDVANVTIKAADEANRPTLTWYYGIGYVYYSANNGYYSEQHYVERTAKSTATRWGCTLRVAATGFLAENIIFENSFNCRVVADELADGVWPEVDPADGGKPDRTVEGYDARARVAVERAAAFAGDATNYECYKCDFISSQDTLYTGYNGYFKECYIEGGTDFIFGGNSILFEDCTLAWHGYSDQQVGGYLTACQTSSAPVAGTPNLATNGYLFRDCTVTTSKYYTDNQFAPGAWGRNWGGAKCQVIFLNTKVDGIGTPSGWTDMGGPMKDSVVYVDGVVDKDGNVVNTAGAAYNPNGTMEANGYAVIADKDYFGAWVPKHYGGEIVLEEYTSIFQFGISNGAPVYDGLQGSGAVVTVAASETNDPDGMTIVADASNGKLHNANRTDEWSQCNDGTKFTIPVVNGTIITFGGYNDGTLSDGATAFKKTEQYKYVGEEGTVTLTAAGIGYISNITVVTPTNPEPYDPTMFKINVTPGYTNGTVSVNYTEAAAGQAVAITAEPEEGYVIDKYEVKTASGADVAVNKGVFAMPAEDVTITITFVLYVQPEQGSSINYVMDFRKSGAVVDGVEITTQGEYQLFDRYVTLKNLRSDNDHGLAGAGPIEVQVPGSVDIVVGTCAFDDVKIVVTDAAGNEVGVSDDVVGASQGMTAGGNGTFNCYGADNGSVDFTYEGGATTLTISFESSTNGASSSARFWLPYLSVVSIGGGSDVTETPEPSDDPTPAEPVNVSAVLNNGAGTLLTEQEIADAATVSFGVAADGTRVEADSADAVMVVNGKYHNDHGMTGINVTAAVSGPAKITVGSCTFGSDATVTDAAGNAIAVKKASACWSRDTSNIGVAYYNGEATTLTITGGGYVPYVAVEEIDASEIPNEATLTFDASAAAAEGSAPAEITVEIGAEATIPANRTLYIDGQTLVAWTDGTNTYAPGEAVAVTEDITLTPVFEANTAALGDAEATVNYSFRQDEGTPVVSFQNNTGFIVYQANIGDAVIDVKMIVDATSGKLANANWQDWAQVNGGTKFIVPVIEGSVVTMGDLYGDDGEYTIGGEALVGDGGTYTATEAGTVEIVAGANTGSYWRGFTVTYPAIAE